MTGILLRAVAPTAGALVSRYSIPDALKADYGDPTSYMVFARLKIQ